MIAEGTQLWRNWRGKSSKSNGGGGILGGRIDPRVKDLQGDVSVEAKKPGGQRASV